MRLLTILTASILLSASALPALAIDAKDAPAIYDASDLSDEADIALWCGAAFTLATDPANNLAPADAAEGNQTKANTLLTRAATLMVTDEGMTAEDAGALAEAYTYHVADQIITRTGEPDYTQDDCEVEAAKP